MKAKLFKNPPKDVKPLPDAVAQKLGETLRDGLASIGDKSKDETFAAVDKLFGQLADEVRRAEKERDK